jgi:hypothetical protein
VCQSPLLNYRQQSSINLAFSRSTLSTISLADSQSDESSTKTRKNAAILILRNGIVNEKQKADMSNPLYDGLDSSSYLNWRGHPDLNPNIDFKT